MLGRLFNTAPEGGLPVLDRVNSFTSRGSNKRTTDLDGGDDLTESNLAALNGEIRDLISTGNYRYTGELGYTGSNSDLGYLGQASSFHSPSTPPCSRDDAIYDPKYTLSSTPPRSTSEDGVGDVYTKFMSFAEALREEFGVKLTEVQLLPFERWLHEGEPSHGTVQALAEHSSIYEAHLPDQTDPTCWNPRKSFSRPGSAVSLSASIKSFHSARSAFMGSIKA